MNQMPLYEYEVVEYDGKQQTVNSIQFKLIFSMVSLETSSQKHDVKLKNKISVI
jgi:hypothetical protein